MCDPIDIQIDESDLRIDLGDVEAELDALLAEVANDQSLQELPGMEAGPPLKIDRAEMRRRHIREARLLQRAGLEFFAKKGQKPPRCA